MVETSRQTYDRWVHERHQSEAYRERHHRAFSSWKADLWLGIVLWIATLAIIGGVGYALASIVFR